MQIVKRDRPLTFRPEDIYLGIEGGKGDRPVAGINGDARVAAAEQGVTTVYAFSRGTAASRLALVAGEWLAAAKIGASGALEQIAAEARHIAKLLRRPPPQRLRERGIVAHEATVSSDVAHPRQGAKHQFARTGGVEIAQLRQRIDVDDAGGCLDIQLHQIVKRRAARQKTRPGTGGRNRPNCICGGPRLAGGARE